MLNYLYVGIGGALGSVLRFWLSDVIATWFGGTFPFGTIFVNVTGSFAIGFLATVTGPEGAWAAPLGGRVFLMAGICGGYTTFSAFSLQTLILVQKGEWTYAGLNAFVSFVLCFTAVWLGFAAARMFNLSRGA